MSQSTRRLVTAVALVIFTGVTAVAVLIGVLAGGSDAAQTVAYDDGNALATPSSDTTTQPAALEGQSVESFPTPQETDSLQLIPRPTPPLNRELLIPVTQPTMLPADGSAEVQPIPSPTPEPSEFPLSLAAPSPPVSTAPVLTTFDGTLQIPRIGVSAEIVPVGITEAGTMGVPPSPWEVGWYKFGSAPGEPGKVVIDGHLDSQDGPAIFWDLNQLEPGDLIQVPGGDGTTHIYAVTESAVYQTNDAPLSKIFGSDGRPELVLITCDGTFDHSTRNYDQRLVVYAEMVGSL